MALSGRILLLACHPSCPVKIAATHTHMKRMTCGKCDLIKTHQDTKKSNRISVMANTEITTLLMDEATAKVKSKKEKRR